MEHKEGVSGVKPPHTSQPHTNRGWKFIRAANLKNDRMPEYKRESARRMRKNPTPAEAALWERLRLTRGSGARFVRQKPISGYIVDFWCSKRRLAVEVDGPYHAGRIEMDRRRDAHLSALGIKTLRLANEEVLNDIEGALSKIALA